MDKKLRIIKNKLDIFEDVIEYIEVGSNGIVPEIRKGFEKDKDFYEMCKSLFLELYMLKLEDFETYVNLYRVRPSVEILETSIIGKLIEETVDYYTLLNDK